MFKDIEKKLNFIEKLDEFKFIKRSIFLKDESLEDDAQHSWHIAMMVMILGSDIPDLNMEKCLKIAIIHDIPEIYSGDTVIFDKNLELTKEEREKDAINKFIADMDDSNKFEFKTLWEEYKTKSSREARFVNEIDKLHPMIQTVLVKGKSWHHWRMEKDKLRENKRSKITDEFGLRDILEIYLKKAEEGEMYYRNLDD